MTAADLLPSNATRLERDLSRSSDVLPTLGPGTQLIRTAKCINIPDDVVPWLIYEYGLGEITPSVSQGCEIVPGAIDINGICF